MRDCGITLRASSCAGGPRFDSRIEHVIKFSKYELFGKTPAAATVRIIWEGSHKKNKITVTGLA